MKYEIYSAMGWYSRKRAVIAPGVLASLTKQQNELRKQIILTPLPKKIDYIAGCDSSIMEDKILSVFVLLTYPELTEIEVVSHISTLTLPYIPGFLSFREIPNLLEAFKKLHKIPSLIMVDGQGIMHPRRMGIATQLGITLNIPTIGVAKSRLTGIFTPPDHIKGSYTYVSDKNEVLGVALCNKDKTNPLFISPGHKCSVADALTMTINTTKAHKLPEPTRIADKYSKELKFS